MKIIETTNLRFEAWPEEFKKIENKGLDFFDFFQFFSLFPLF